MSCPNVPDDDETFLANVRGSGLVNQIRSLEPETRARFLAALGKLFCAHGYERNPHATCSCEAPRAGECQ